MPSAFDRQQMIQMAFGLSATVDSFVERARRFFYTVMLSGHACPRCEASLEMIQEGRCRCVACRHPFDPTVAFQRCRNCGGTIRLVIRRYQCRQCGSEVPSRFLFDGLVFDAEYFRQKMAESRERRAERREEIREMLSENRSEELTLPPADLGTVPGLVDALNALSQGTLPEIILPPAARFNLQRYETHVQAHLGANAVSLEQIPPLSENARLDKIWRFIAIIFLAHAGLALVWQAGPAIMVKQRETDTEGRGVPGDLEDADGVEGPVGRVAAW